MKKMKNQQIEIATQEASCVIHGTFYAHNPIPRFTSNIRSCLESLDRLKAILHHHMVIHLCLWSYRVTFKHINYLKCF